MGMQSISRSMILGLCRGVGSPPPSRWLPAALARRDAPLMASVSALRNQHLNRLSRSVYRPWSTQRIIEVRNEKKLPSCTPFACAITKCMDSTKITEEEETNEVTENNDTGFPGKAIWYPHIYRNSSHRDGAIYKNMYLKEEWFDCDLTDRTESPLVSDLEESKFCYPQPMLQFFSLTLAECQISNGPIQLYGYIGVRDDRDCLLNYIFNRSREEPIMVQQGSLIEMTGPKRGIFMASPVLIEFDMRIKSGEQEEDDLDLIDGASECNERRPWKPAKNRIPGKCGTVDMSLTYMEHAVEATIEVVISEVQRGFGLSVTSLVYVMEDYEEVQLFHGAIDEPCHLRRFVVAVTMGTRMLLKLKVDNAERFLFFGAHRYGWHIQQTKLDLASVGVKVTWTTF